MHRTHLQDACSFAACLGLRVDWWKTLGQLEVSFDADKSLSLLCCMTWHLCGAQVPFHTNLLAETKNTHLFKHIKYSTHSNFLSRPFCSHSFAHIHSKWVMRVVTVKLDKETNRLIILDQIMIPVFSCYS